LYDLYESETIADRTPPFVPAYKIEIAQLNSDGVRLRRSIDDIKVRAYELGQRELHDLALAALRVS
jgi:hypothetical protein